MSYAGHNILLDAHRTCSDGECDAVTWGHAWYEQFLKHCTFSMWLIQVIPYMPTYAWSGIND